MTWQHVFAALSRDIRSGRASPGQLLPSQKDLSGQFKTSRYAVRRAFDELRNLNLVESRRGKGAVVRDPKIEHRVSPRSCLREDAANQGFEHSTSSTHSWRRPAPQDVSGELRVARRDAVLTVERVVYLNGRTLQIVWLHFDAQRFPDIDKILREEASLGDALAAFGVDGFRRGRTLLRARKPTSHETVLLEIPPLQPVMEMTSSFVDPDSQPVSVAKSVSRADRIRYLV